MGIRVRISSDERLKELIAALKRKTLKASIMEEVGAAKTEIARRLYENIQLGLRMGRSAWKELHPMTILMKGSAQPLLNEGELERAIQVIEQGGKVFVGIPEGAQRSDGTSLEMVAEVMEYGATIPVTDRVRAFFAANGYPLKKETQVIVIPARPFFEPAIAETQEQISEEVGVLQDRIIEGLVR